MAWTNPLTWVASQIVTAAQMNTHVRDNLNVLRAGGLEIAGQDINDFIYASSGTQLARVGTAGPGGSGRVPMYNAPDGWALISLYPVGSIYENASDSTNPATLFGFGTWVALAPGRVTVAIDATQTEFDTIAETGGAKTHTLTTAEMPVHTHTQDAHTHTQDAHAHTLPIGLGGSAAKLSSNNDYASTSTTSTSSVAATNQATTATNQNTGGGAAHNILQPYLVIYRWVRTA